MAKETGNIHYLNKENTPVAPVKETAPEPPSPHEPPAPDSYQELIVQLQSRLDRIERDFTHDTPVIMNSQKEISRLVHLLEEKIEKVTEELVAARMAGSQQEANLLSAALKKVKDLVGRSEFKSFLNALWFGKKEESYEFDEFGMDPSFIRRLKPFFDFLYYKYWRVSVEGLPHIPSEGRGLIVANHSGTLPYDGSMIAASIVNDHNSRRDVRFLVEDFVYHFPFLGTFMYRIGGVRACQENAERLLTKDHLVTVFPEGVKGIGKHYKNRYRLQRFGRGGFIKLALKTNAPVIPAAVIGAEEIHPLLYKSTILAKPFRIPYIPITPTLPLLGVFGLLPLPSKWKIIFGEPIQFSSTYGPKDADDQLLVNRLSETVRGKIQEMIVEALKSRRSVWFG